MSGDYHDPSSRPCRGQRSRPGRASGSPFSSSASAPRRPSTTAACRSSRRVTGSTRSTRSPTCAHRARTNSAPRRRTLFPASPWGPQQAVDLADLVQIVSSSGTTGRPLDDGLTRRDVDTWAETCAQTFYTAGFRPGDVVAHLVGLPMVAGGLPVCRRLPPPRRGARWSAGSPPSAILADAAGCASGRCWPRPRFARLSRRGSAGADRLPGAAPRAASSSSAASPACGARACAPASRTAGARTTCARPWASAT